MSVRVASLQVRDVDSNHHPYPKGVLLPDQGVRFRHVQVSGDYGAWRVANICEGQVRDVDYNHPLPYSDIVLLPDQGVWFRHAQVGGDYGVFE